MIPDDITATHGISINNESPHSQTWKLSSLEIYKKKSYTNIVLSKRHRCVCVKGKMAEIYPVGTRSESERLVRDWGFRHVFTWSDGRYG